ncbi:30S ribosomal protein S1 [candidate division KSB1 bacterium]|nr:30S ribosomal protein S1 [candidate division KSB1 bacterium]
MDEEKKDEETTSEESEKAEIDVSDQGREALQNQTEAAGAEKEESPGLVPARGEGEESVSPAGQDEAEPAAEEKPALLDEVQEMERLYESTMREIKEGEIVSGKIITINDREVAVDIGFKSEGLIPIEEFDNPESLSIGDDVEVFLDRIEGEDGELVLSKGKADFIRLWEKVQEKYRNNEVVQGKCIRRIKGGIVVDLMGLDAFLPGSQIDIRPVRDFDEPIGKTMDFRIVNINEARRNIVLSRKVLLEESMKGLREKILSELEVGQMREVVVKNITDFGAFVDLGGIDGLLHITDLSWGRVSHPSEIVSLDEKIQVKVLNFDKERQRISVGLKQLQPHPWEGIGEKYEVGQRITGKVVSIANYGAFVQLEKGIEGLIHISEMSWTQHIKHPSAVLSIGELVEAIILSINKEGRKISLGLKQLEPDPWEGIEKKYAPSTRHKGLVKDLVPFGAFVELEEGIEGLVHISDLSWTKKVRHPGEILKKGDEIEVVILGMERRERRIALGYKQIQENPWDVFEEKYPVGGVTEGKVVRQIEKGIIVRLPLEVEGFVPKSQLPHLDQTRTVKVPEVEQTIPLKVIEFDKENKRIVLSVIAAEKEMDKEELKKYRELQAEKEIRAEVKPVEEAETKTQESLEAVPKGEGEPPQEEIQAEVKPVEKAETKPQESVEAVPKGEGEPPQEEIQAEAKSAEEAEIQPQESGKTVPKKDKVFPQQEIQAVESEEKPGKRKKKPVKQKKKPPVEEKKTDTGGDVVEGPDVGKDEADTVEN